tara:strand:+ start:3171 stop:5018 length:1848 start_codon:yes stop_codon:yes gene_type:complete
MRPASWLSVSAHLILMLVAISGLQACAEPEPYTGLPSSGGLLIGDEVTCGSPSTGFDRLTEQGLERGVDLQIEIDEEPYGCFVVPGGVVAQDLDLDGDDDLLVFRARGFPHLFENDSTGHFERHPQGLDLVAEAGRWVAALAAVDISGDSLPEVFIVGPGYAGMFRNQGELRFGPLEVLYDQQAFPKTCFNTMSFGDVDGDGDLDLYLPGLDRLPEAGLGLEGECVGECGTFDPLLLNDGGSFSVHAELSTGAVPGLSILGAFTDRDQDGDMDLLVATDRPMPPLPPSAFFRNDGLDALGAPQLENDAEQLGAAIRFSAMGLAAADLNGDGLMDYCMSDDYIYCLVSDGLGGYVESGLAMGLSPDLESHPLYDPENNRHNHGSDHGGSEDQHGGRQGGQGGQGEGEGEQFCQWFGWSLEFVDLDHDGNLDLPVVAGSTPPRDPSSPLYCDCSFQPDAIWQGLDGGGFVERSLELGFNEVVDHYGLVAADFDGDGARDLLAVPDEGRPKLWMNRCSAGAWVEVELRGPEANSEGFGARVQISAGGREWLREMHNLRSVGQGPSRLHFGLGDVAELDELRVTWPDGSVTFARGVPVNRRLAILHEAAATPQLIDMVR